MRALKPPPSSLMDSRGCDFWSDSLFFPVNLNYAEFWEEAMMLPTLASLMLWLLRELSASLSVLMPTEPSTEPDRDPRI